jgi:hypothetical protein
LDEHFLHYPFSKGIGFWVHRHVGYADFEARELLMSLRDPVGVSMVFQRDGQARRRALKRLFYRMPLRPALKFLVLYVVRRGFLDGKAGLNYALMQSFYEFMISLRAMELSRIKRGLPV